LGTRVYAQYNPEIALKYINNIIHQYKQDGLAFQRYGRHSQSGLGDDILAGNGMAVVGLYRNIFGIQPKYNRLYLEPHLPATLNGTSLKYKLRDADYCIVLKADRYTVSAEGFSVCSNSAFGISTAGNRLEYYAGKSSTPSLSIERTIAGHLDLGIVQTKGEKLTEWTLGSEKSMNIAQTLYGFDAGMRYHLRVGSEEINEGTADNKGCLLFTINLKAGQEKHFIILPAL